MRTVGIILKEERLRKGFSLEQVEKATKIRAKFLTALEADDYKRMPAFPYIQGFVRNYSTFLGLRPTTMLAILRREYIQKGKERQKEVIEQPLTKSPFEITPNKVITVVVALLVFALFSYFLTQYRALHAPPPLTLESPKDNDVVSTEQLPVFGNTDADATLTINNEPVLVKEDGKYYKDIPINVGTNTISVEATSRAGEKTKIVRTVTRSE